MRSARNVTAVFCVTLCVVSTGAKAQGEAPFVRNGEAGFVVSHIEYALAEDAEKSGACPAGMSKNLAEIYALTPAGQRRADESEEAYGNRMRHAMRRLGTSDDGRDFCQHPEAAPEDIHYRSVQVSGIPVAGIDIDGVESEEDFPGEDPGVSGVDNQFYRVVGCSRSFQSSGQSNLYAITMLTGAWGIVVELSGVDDIVNDEDIEVGIHANADPIRLDPDREPLAYATYARHPSSQYRATTRGKIVEGVITTEPVDVRFLSDTNSMYLDRPLRDARLHATLSETGKLEGYLAGFTPVEDMYDVQYGFRSGRMANGEPGPMRLRVGSSNGAARVLGYTCQGAWQALHEHADGHPDPVTGEYTSISTQYRIEAIPAFVVETANTGQQGDSEVLAYE